MKPINMIKDSTKNISTTHTHQLVNKHPYQSNGPMRTTMSMLASIGLGVVLLTGCTEKDTEVLQTVSATEDLPADIHEKVNTDPQLRLGYAVYSRNCVGCHGIKGDGQGPAAAHFKHTKPRDFQTGIFKFRSTPNGQLPLDSDLDRTIRQGLQDSPMPSFALMPKRERDAVIAFIKLYSPAWSNPLKTPHPVDLPVTVPDDLLTTNRVLRGRFGYVSMGCASCHGMTGRGNGPSSVTLKDDWGNPVKPYNYHQGAPKGGDTPLDVYRTFRTGVTPMPMFKNNTLALITQDRKELVFARLVEQEQKIVEPILSTLATDEQVRDWQKNDPPKAEKYADDRAWDLVAYTLWLRESSKPQKAAIWPSDSKQLADTPRSGG